MVRRRVLLIGDEPLVGTDAATAGAVPTLATALSVRGQRPSSGTDLDVLWGLVPVMRAIAAGADAWRVWRYDAVVVVLAQVPARSVFRLERLLLQVLVDLADAGPLVLVLADDGSRTPVSRGNRQRVVRLLQALAAAGRVLPSVAAALDDQGRLLEPARLADEVLTLLEQDSGPPTAGSAAVKARRAAPQDEPQRQQAVDRVADEIGALTSDLLRVVLLARGSFDVPYAQLNLVTRGALRTVAFTGRSSEGLAGTLSELVVQRDSALLIADAQQDPRLAGVAETHGPDAIRFYVGFPIESLDGYRIGTLCVFDTDPHPVEAEDAALIRDIALLAEAEINALASSS